MISWEDDTGTTHTYDLLPDVLYSPESTANIISITKLGKIFGSTDQPVSRDESGTWTDASHLTLMDQADLTNIPLDAESYCKEVSEGLTEQDIAMMARPKVLTPLQQEFMHLHEKMYHTPFHVMIRLARTGVLPKRFLKLRNDTPICISCNFGKAHKRPWWSKGKRSSPIRKESDTQVGDCVSTDQIVSAQPGLIPQMNGFLTSDRIWGVTVFVDHARHTVKRYHADNGRYADQGFLASINSNDQTITFCGVGAHHQNGIVEDRIRLITETARTLLLHAQRHWPEYITTMLWPFAVKAAIKRISYLSFDLEGKSAQSSWHLPWPLTISCWLCLSGFEPKDETRLSTV
eukprot:scaffold74389_cov38-Cyclotella_meneghiniana.AAC.4